MTRQSSPDIYASPRSSSDDEEIEAVDLTKDKSSAPRVDAATEAETSASSRKRKEAPTRSSGRNKKLIQSEDVLKDIDNEPETDLEQPVASGASITAWSAFDSSVSQGKRAKTYGSHYRQKQSTQPKPSQAGTSREQRTKRGIHVPSLPKEELTSTKELEVPKESETGARPKRKIKDFDLGLETDTGKRQPKVTTRLLEIADVSEPATSSTTSATEMSNIFSQLSNDVYDSDSALSSADSNISFSLAPRQKDDLFMDEDFGLQCPVCKAYLGADGAPSSSQISGWSLRQKQDFCYQHRQKDARTRWRESGYPEIDWVELETERIPKHIPHLRNVLQQKTSSFYLSELVQHIASAKGKRKIVEQYLRQGVLEVQGYYGPKGGKIMVSSIVEQLSPDLQRQLKIDKTLRTAGVGSYISAVLLPELIMRLVMEDMDVTDSKVARHIMANSTNLGVLLNPDDDHIEMQDEADDEE